MDYKDNFTCPVCLQLAKLAVVSSCCTKVFCSQCLNNVIAKYGHCPCCRSTNVTCQTSNITRKLISQIKVPCQYCQQQVQNGEMDTHLTKCPNVMINCRICNNPFPQGKLTEHTIVSHQTQARKYIIEYISSQKKGDAVKAPIQRPQKGHNYFLSVVNKFGRKAKLGTTSKYYCAGKLEGKCSCCDGGCGPDNGQNCDGCMQLDVKRWKLPRTYLINSSGYICQILMVQGSPKVTCFRILGTKKEGLFARTESTIVCKIGSPCSACAQVQNSLKLGRYAGLY